MGLVGWKQKEFGLVQKHYELMSESVSSIEKPYLLDLQSMNRQQKRQKPKDINQRLPDRKV